ncbi:hypothetical protein BH09BAC1_BH09BAC1_03920 [soil metagenome]
MRSLLGIILIGMLFESNPSFTTVKTYAAPEAKQAVAVDDTHFYAIDDALVAKYDFTGKQIAVWVASPESHIKHLNSGFIKDGKLYMAHSNYPDIPRTSTIEMLDTKTMKHEATHQFGTYDGAANVVLWHEDAWWVLFGHYSGTVAEPDRTAADTRLERLDKDWKRLDSFTFPEEVIRKFQPKSISGAAFGPDGYLYCTGHDASEVYRLSLPKSGTVLTYDRTLPLACEGQGIAWYGKYLYSIKRTTRQVVVSSIK